MSKMIAANGSVFPCCAAPPAPDPAEPPCKNPADDRYGVTVIDGVAFLFCSPDCRGRFLAHEDWGPTIAADVLSKQ